MTVSTTLSFEEVVSGLEFPPEIPKVWLPPNLPRPEQKLRWLAALADDKLTLSLMNNTLPVVSISDEFADALGRGFPKVKDELREMHGIVMAWIALAVRLQNEMGIEVRVGHIELKVAA